jgi:hypothetical protein
MAFKTKKYHVVLVIFIAIHEKEILTLVNASINTHTQTHKSNKFDWIIMFT